MDSKMAQALRGLLETQRIASLGTLHGGEPYVSMVPFALLPGGAGFVIHVSELAAHTKDMRADPHVSLLVVAPQSPQVPPQALARATVQGHAVQYLESTPGHAEAGQAYLSRFPETWTIFALPDFSLFAIRPRSIRFVGGYGQARTFAAEGLARILSD